MTQPTPCPPYDALGGADGLQRLVQRFYALMDELPEAYTVRRLHPDSLSGSATSLFQFLSGWLGGPPLYERQHGHPRLRMRHLPYRIGSLERDEWLLCMRLALAEQVTDPALRSALEQAISTLAQHIVNTDDHAPATCTSQGQPASTQICSYH